MLLLRLPLACAALLCVCGEARAQAPNYSYQTQVPAYGTAVGVAIDPTTRNIFVDDLMWSGLIYDSTGTQIGYLTGLPDQELPGCCNPAIDPVTHNIIVPNHTSVQIFNAQGVWQRDFGTAGTGDGQFSQADGVAVDPVSENILVADENNNRVQIFSADGTFQISFGTAGTGDGQFNAPYLLAIDPNSRNIVVADNSDRVQIFTSAGAFVNSLSAPAGGLTVDPATGNIIVDNLTTSTVQIYKQDGTLLTQFGGSGNGSGEFVHIQGVAIDPVSHTIIVADDDNNNLQFFAPAPALGAAVLPGTRTLQVGSPATVFATILNSDASDLNNCQIGLPTDGSGAGLSLTYQTTDASTNALTGRANQPVTIASGAGQSFLLSLSAGAPASYAALQLDYACDGTTPAPPAVGVNTLDLGFSATPVADVIALAATASQDGTLTLSQGQSGAFAVATDNAGAAASLTATVDTGGAQLPLSLGVCQTDSATGKCLVAPAGQVPITIKAGATPTFSVFATASGDIPFAPSTARIFIRFVDGSGQSHGATSVAIRTE